MNAPHLYKLGKKFLEMRKYQKKISKKSLFLKP